MHLSGEELVHHCYHVLVQIQRFVFVRAGSAFIISAVLVTSMSGECTKLGFMLGEHGRLHNSAGLCMSKGGCGLAGAQPNVRGRQSIGQRNYGMQII